MKKVIFLIILGVLIFSCNENLKSSVQKNYQITFKELDSIKSIPESEIMNYLLKINYVKLENEFQNQWKSKNSDDMIQFNGKGSLMFLTYNQQKFNIITSDLNKSDYKYFGKSFENGLEVESYSKRNENIFLSLMNNPENEEKIYSLIFF